MKLLLHLLASSTFCSARHHKGETIDAPMEMLYDINHVINLELDDGAISLYAEVSTAMSDLILMSESCEMCYTWTGTKINTEEVGASPLLEKSFDYFHLTERYSVNSIGDYYKKKVCISEKCAEDMPVFVVEKADPYLSCLGDGFIGLAPVSDEKNNGFSLLEWLYKHEMIDKKAFGIHTHLYKSKEDPSTIRLGGYDKSLFPQGH